MAQNKNGPIIGLAIFIMLSVLLAVGFYMTWADNQKLTTDLLTAQNKAQETESSLKAQIAGSNTLKGLIGAGQNDEIGVGETGDTSTINGRVTARLTDVAADGTSAPASLLDAVQQKTNASWQNTQSATDRQNQLNKRTEDYNNMVQSKDAEIAQIKAARNRAEEQLQQREATHSEELAQREATIDDLSKEKSRLERELADTVVQYQRQIDALNIDVATKRQSIIALRKRLVDAQDLTFSTPDGLITSVDQLSELVYINLGENDGLRTGVTFSVYTPVNSGVGRNDTSEIKGRIEIVDILGAHRAEGRIVQQREDLPIAADDPVYSPIFQTGQSLEIAIAGRVSVDGLDREQLIRLVNAAGARIISEVDDEGDFTDGRGNRLSREEAEKRITSRTRFLVIADQGDSESSDTNVQKLAQKIRENTQVLKDKALNLGIHEIGLSTFLEHIGYSRKQVSWTPERQQPFPGKLVNGARSSAVNATSGQRFSLGNVSGLYSDRKKAVTESYGQTSGVYSQQ